jgi:alkylated DNA repair dioxygenase AlkB
MKQRSLAGFTTSSQRETKKSKRSDCSGKFLSTVENSKFATCPLCQVCLPIHVLISHAAACNGTASKEMGKPALHDGTRPAVFSLSPSDDRKDNADNVNKNDVDVLVTQQEMKPANAWWTQANTPRRCLTTDNPITPSSEPIPGLHLYHDFISEDEENQILAELDGTLYPETFLPWQFNRFNGPNRGKRWGVHCNLRDRRVGHAENEMPPFFNNILLPKLRCVVPMKGCTPNEANAIDYNRTRGDCLQDHVDDRQLSKEPIANLSIAGDCYMTFINQKKAGSKEPVRVRLPRRTLQVLTGNARYDYSHGIRNQDLLDDRRVSVTMRESPLSTTKQNVKLI